MNSKLENSRSMYFATLSVLNDSTNKSIYSSNAPLNADVAILSDKLKALDTLRIVQEKSITGYTEKKYMLRFALEQSSISFIGPIKSYADSVSDSALYESVNYSESRLTSCRDTIFMDRCNVIAAAITDHTAALLAYNITASNLSDYLKAIDDYRKIHQLPREMKSAGAAATKQINTLCKEMSSFLAKRIDNAMLAYKVSNPEFFNQFKNARKIINLAGVRTTLKGHLIEANTSRRLRGIVIIKETGETILANRSGIFKKTVPEGIYTVIAKVPGCLDTEIPGVSFFKGKILNLDITLQKAA